MTQTFPWDRIARYDAAQAAATNLCARLLGSRGIDVRGDLQELFGELGFETVEMKLAHLAAHRGAIFQPELGLGYATNFLVPGVGVNGAVAIDHTLVDTALAAIGDVPAATVTLDDWDHGLVTWLMLRIVKLLTGLGVPPVTLAAGRRPPERIAEEVAGPWTVHEIVVDVRLDGQRGWVRLFLPEPTLGHLTHAADHAPVRPTGAAARVPHSIRLVAGHTELAEPELAALGSGDIILFDAHALKVGALQPTSSGRVAAGTMWLEAEVTAKDGNWQFAIAGDAPHQGRQMNQDSMTTQQLGEDTPISIEAVVGRTTLSFAELARLKPGQVLVADRAVGEPVEIVANGTVVAQGELVDVEGRLGVRVLTLSR